MQLPTTADQVAPLQVVEGVPLNPVLQVALQRVPLMVLVQFEGQVLLAGGGGGAGYPEGNKAAHSSKV